MCALDGDILVVKQRDAFYNALAQTFSIQIHNNAFIVSGDIAMFRKKGTSMINGSQN